MPDFSGRTSCPQADLPLWQAIVVELPVACRTLLQRDLLQRVGSGLGSWRFTL